MRPFDPRLLRWAPASRTAVAKLALLGGLQGVVAIGQAFAVSALVVALVRDTSLTVPAVATGALFATRGILAGTSELVAAGAGTRVSGGLREQLLRAWLRRPAEERPEPAASLTLATQGTASVEPYVARYLPALVQAAVLPALALVTIGVIDWVSGLIVLLTVPLLPVFAALIGHATAAETRQRWQAMAALSGHFLDVVRGLPTLVSFGRARAQSETIERVSERHRRATVRTLRLAFLSSAALELLATISVAVVAVATGLRLATGTMDLGVALTVILLAPEAYWPIRRVGAEFHAAADGAAALEDVFAHLTRAPSSSVEPSTDSVRVRGLGYRHPGEEHDVLHGLDLQAGAGLTVVTGPSGVGKSTLLELLAGLRVPSGGTVEAPRAHLVTQRPFLFAGPLRESLRIGVPDDIDDTALRSALRELGLERLVAGLPGGLDAFLGDDGFGLSAGQRARLALARALLSTAPLLLLDEPTAHLDDEAASLVHAAIVRVARDRTVIAVTHRPELLRYADRHLTLSPTRAPSPDGACAHLAPVRSVHTGSHGSEGGLAGARQGGSSAGATAGPAGDATVVRQHLGGREDTCHAAVRPAPRGLLAAALLGGLASASGVALTATSGWLIVQASYQPVILTLLTAIVAVRAFGIARPALRYAERIRSHDVALGDLTRRRVGVYDRLVPLTPARLGRRGRAALLGGIVDDLEDEVYATVRVVVPVLSVALAGGITAAGTAMLLPAAGAVVAALLLVAAVVAAGAWALERRHQHRSLAARAEATRVAAMVTAQALELQAVGGGGRAARWVEDADRRLTDAAARQARGRALVHTLLPAVTALATVATAIVLTTAVPAGLHPAVGALLLLTPLAVGDALGVLPDAMSGLARAQASRSRLAMVLGQPAAVDDPPGSRSAGTSSSPGCAAPAPRLRLEQVTASWVAGRAGGRSDLEPSTLDLAPGEHVAVTGPNGSGKSTLLAVLARHLDPAGGRYLVDGEDVRGLALDGTRSLVAFLDDEPHVFASTLRENLRLARPGAIDAELRTALEQSGLGRWLARLPRGLDTRLGATGRGVSGGERTRLGLARVLLSARPVLLLDEPVAQLDHATATAVLADLHRSARDRTVIMVSHRPEGITDFDRVLALAGSEEHSAVVPVGL